MRSTRVDKEKHSACLLWLQRSGLVVILAYIGFTGSPACHSSSLPSLMSPRAETGSSDARPCRPEPTGAS